MFAHELRIAGLTAFVAGYPGLAIAGLTGTFPSLEPDPTVLGAADVRIAADLDLVPVFRAGPRDRLRAGLGGWWLLGDRVVLDARWQALADRHPDGHQVVGPGDLELGTLLRLPLLEGARQRAREQGRRGPSVGLGWRIKLPNAADEGELGSDETDLSLVAAVASDLGPLRGWLGGGVAILGDPLLLAAQDDILFVQAELSWDGASAAERAWLPRTALALDVTFPSPSNPARGLVGLALAWGDRWCWTAEAAAGLTAASPTVVFELGFGRRVSR